MHPLEIALINALNKYGNGLSPEELSEASKIDLSKIRRAIEWLKYKGIIKVEEETKQIISLTDRGKEYLKKGMPDRRIYETLLKGPMTFKEVMEEAGVNKDEISVVIGNWKKQGIVDIYGGKIFLNEKEKVGWEVEDLLKILSEPKYVNEIPEKYMVYLGRLKERGIVEVKDVKVKRIYLLKKIKVKEEKLINEITPEVIKNKLWEKMKFRKYDIYADVGKMIIGKEHPYLKYVDWVKEKLISLGFEEVKGPIVESCFYNCDALFMPQDHPAREIHDIFFVDAKPIDVDKKLLERVKKIHEEKWRYNFDEKKSLQMVLRSQTTAVSIRTLLNSPKIPGRYFSIDRNFRPDVIDWSHLIELEQLEGIVIGKNLNIRHLLGLLKLFAEEIIGVKEYKFVPGYFPFTEPSVELHAKFGDRWIEMGGAGVFRPEINEIANVKYPVIAWGLGIQRMYMIKNNIKDIRLIFSNDLNYLRES